MSLLSNYREETSGLNDPLVIPPIAPAQPISNAPELPEIPDAGPLPELDQRGLPQDPLAAPFTLPPTDAPLPPNPVVPTFGEILFDIDPTNPWKPADIPRATMPDDIDNYIQPFLEGGVTPSQLLQNAFKPQIQGGAFNPFQWKFGDMGEGPLGALLYGLNLPFAAALGLASDLARFNASQLEGFNNAKNNIGRRLRESGGNLLQLGKNVVKDFGDGFVQTQKATADPSGMSFFTQALGGRAFSFSDDEYNKKGQLSPFAYISSKLTGVNTEGPLREATTLPETPTSVSIRGNKIIDAGGSLIGVPLQGILNIPGISGSEPIQLPKLSDWTADRFKQAELTPEIFRKRVVGFALDAITESLIGGLPKKIANSYTLSKNGVPNVVSPVPLQSGTASNQQLLLAPPPQVTAPGQGRLPPPPSSTAVSPGIAPPPAPAGLLSPPPPTTLPDQINLPPAPLGTIELPSAPPRQLSAPPAPAGLLPPGNFTSVASERPILLGPPQRMVPTPPVIELNGVPSNVVELRAALENLSDPPRITPETTQPQTFAARSQYFNEDVNTNITVNYIPGRNRAVMDWQNFQNAEDFATGINLMLNPTRENFLSDIDFDTALSANEFIIPNVPDQFASFFEGIGFSRMNDYVGDDVIPTGNFRRYFDEVSNLENFRNSVAADIDNYINEQIPWRSSEQIPYTGGLDDIFEGYDPARDPSDAFYARQSEIFQRMDSITSNTEVFGRNGRYELTTTGVPNELPDNMTLRRPGKNVEVHLEKNGGYGENAYNIKLIGNAANTPGELYKLFKEALPLYEFRDKSFILGAEELGDITYSQKVRVTSLLERLGFDVGWEFQYSRLDNYSSGNLVGDILSPRSRRERFSGWRRNTRLAQIARFVDRPVQEFTNLRMEQIYKLAIDIEQSFLNDKPERFVQETVTTDTLEGLTERELSRAFSFALDPVTPGEREIIARRMGFQNYDEFVETELTTQNYIDAFNIFDERGIPYELLTLRTSRELGPQARQILRRAQLEVQDTGQTDFAAMLRREYPEAVAELPPEAFNNISRVLAQAVIRNETPEALAASIRDILYEYEFDRNPEIQRLLNEVTQPDVLTYDMAYREVQLSLPQDMRGSLPQTREAVQALVYADTELETALRSANEVSQYLADIERPLEFEGAVLNRNIDPSMPLYLGTREVQAPLRIGDRLTNNLEQGTSQARRIVENPQELPYGSPEIITFSGDARVMDMESFGALQEQLNDMREMLPEELVDDTINQIYESLAGDYDILPDGTVINPDAFVELGRQSAPDIMTGSGLRAEAYNAAPSEQTALDLQAQIVDDMQQRAEVAITAVDEAINRQAVAEEAVRDLVAQEREMRFEAPEDNPRRLTELTYREDYMEYVRRLDARITVHRQVPTPSRIYATRWERMLDKIDDALYENDPDTFIEEVIRFRNLNNEMFDELNEVYEDYASMFIELNRRQGQWLPSDLFPLLNEICE